jgi:hypothetical protein
MATRYPIPDTGNLNWNLLADVSKVLINHGYPSPDVDDSHRLGQALRLFLHGDPDGPGSTGHVIYLGRTRTGKTDRLKADVQRHLDAGGRVWVYASNDDERERWNERADDLHRIAGDAQLADMLFDAEREMRRRLGLPLGQRETQPLLIALDGLHELLLENDAALTTRLDHLLAGGCGVGVRLVITTQRLEPSTAWSQRMISNATVITTNPS